MTGVTGIPSIFIGAAIYHYLGLNSSAIAIAAVIILYITFLVFGILVQKHKRIEHVLTGRFESEAELANYRSQILAQEHPSLSARELEVVALLLRGRSTPSIAEALYISENTAKSHIQHIYKKMGIGSRQELLEQAESIPFVSV
jgi:DNA-binding CsgD family transcriptional regulator